MILRRIITVIIALIITLAAIAGGYIAYLNVNGKRLPDRETLPVAEVAAGAAGEQAQDGAAPPTDGAVEGRAEDGGDAAVGQPGDDEIPALTEGKAYRAITYNIGFGAYNHAYSFFMSEGRIAGVGRTKGTMSRAADESAVNKNMKAAMAAAFGQGPDIALFQEVDRDAGRSYKVDEFRMISDAFGESLGGAAFAQAYATDFHTGLLLWPPAHPMGMVRDSGMAMYSRYGVDSAVRVSLPVDESFPEKYFDLDRCFTVARLPVSSGEGDADAETGADADGPSGDDSETGADADGSSGAEGSGAELVLINVHLSAYEAGSNIHSEQMKALAETMGAEREKGNWVIAGGDWNQCFPGSEDAFMGRMETPSWAKPLMEELLPDGFSAINAGNAGVIATCRDSSIPWTPGVSYETILDGWIVSDNVGASADNIDTDYTASDHNPVLLTFTLQ